MEGESLMLMFKHDPSPRVCLLAALAPVESAEQCPEPSPLW